MERDVERVDVVRCPIYGAMVRITDEPRHPLSCMRCGYYYGIDTQRKVIDCRYKSDSEEPQIRTWVVYATQKDYISFRVDARTHEEARELVLSGEVDPYETLDSTITDVEVETTETDLG